jgi:hypothetical protein
VVVLALVFVVVLPAVSPKSSGTTGGATYSGASNSANSYAGGTPGGPWTLLSVVGWDSTTGYSNTSTEGLDCSVTGGSGILSIPAYTGNYSDGTAAAWVFVYGNEYRTSVLFLEYSNGGVSEIGVATGSCGLGLSRLYAIPSGTEDSSAIAQGALNSSGVEDFVRHFSSANATYALVNTGSQTGAEWSIAFSTCSTFPGSGPTQGYGVSVLANATDGLLAYSPTDYVSQNCQYSAPSHGNPLGTSFSWGQPINATGTTPPGCALAIRHYCYEIEVAGSSVTTSDFTLSLRNSVGAVTSWPIDGIVISLITPTSISVDATYSVYTSSWTLLPPFTGQVTGGDSIVLYTASAGTGNGLFGEQLVATGANGYSGSVPSGSFQ